MALERELIERKHRVAREVAVRVLYKGHQLGEQRLDMIVDEKLVVETKSTRELHKSANRQVSNYLRSTNLEIGLLLHFGPEAHFQRMIYRNQRRNPSNPLNPLHPDEPSVSVASSPKLTQPNEAATNELLRIAREDSDRRMRARALSWLGQKDDPRAAKLIGDRLER
jgi:GxxExxY protein